uniref:Transmembrane protein 53 n=1 Tax=Nothobranchius kadleci TaxID=1051664 RepID=A0A1A8D351_NOTKA
MGRFFFCSSFFKTDSTTSDQVITERFVARRIRSGVIYYYSPVIEAGSEAVCPAEDFRTSGTPSLISSLSPTSPPVSDLSDSSSSPPISETASHMTVFSQKQSYSSRPLLVFFSWLGARPDAVAKYRDLYLDRDMDVLLIQSSVIHFLWPRWGLSYGLEVLSILEEPSFSNRAILVHASSIGGYTFTQMLSHVAQEPKRHACLAQRVVGHIYDSLVVGSLEHMATGEGK